MKKNVYVVEDNDDIREMIEFLLNDENYEVHGYATAEAFRNKLNMAEQQPDLIVLDVMLPDGNGLEICDQLKADHVTANIPVLLMSAHANFKSLRPGQAEDFISKPFDIYDFISRIDRYIK
jgi:CheY-like chemotaxis protein